ncbi:MULTISPECIES: oxidoreductase C-terminal domain-containing protein [Actinomadura]|uniref:Oxidoreductase C-terminal domain-containing protein n=1 Tax=Actinomadura yumaensis TaxID=111807 RepID=A0ABW2CI72_9ACTN|nr:oxidoreductase C-terminal domain-containing protein [Actinomadura sp. J1-007]MWK39987.1 hypothetical protein [Actinomadura sp. J1-007]
MYAAGDAARLPRGRGEHWADAQEQGATAARNMLGQDVAHTTVPWCWSDQYGLKIQICGSLVGTPETSGDPARHDAAISFVHDGALCGAVCFNRPKEFRDLRSEIARSEDGPETVKARPV